MTPNETVLIKSLLNGSDTYLEFGSGGSTYLAAERVKERIISVDSSREWHEKVQVSINKLPKKTPDIRFHHVNLGPVKDWGYPAGNDSIANWPTYSMSVCAAESDLFLIDGRFRVACFCESLIHAKNGALIAIHDFSDRPIYHVVLNLARCVAVAERLSVFVKDVNSDTDKAALIADERRKELI